LNRAPTLSFENPHTHTHTHTHTGDGVGRKRICSEMVLGERGFAHRSEFTELGNRVKGRRWDERAQLGKRKVDSAG